MSDCFYLARDRPWPPKRAKYLPYCYAHTVDTVASEERIEAVLTKEEIVITNLFPSTSESLELI